MISFPKQVYLDMNINCNLKCIQCDIHLLKNPPNELTLNQRLRLISELGSWPQKPRLLLSGGEPFLRRNDLYAIAAAAKENGIHASINTNGTILKKEDFEKLPTSGIRSIVFSIDSHLPEVHDDIRGVPGTFEKVTQAVKEIVAASRRVPGSKISIFITSILGEHNLDQVEALMDLSDELGADGLMFQPIQPVFERAAPENWRESSPLWPQNLDKIKTSIDQLLNLKKTGRKLLHSPLQIQRMGTYFKTGQAAKDQCISMKENLIVDMPGNVSLCFNMNRLDLEFLGNVREKPLLEIWKDSRDTASRIEGCNFECGTMLCHSA